jgi:hypothetical protein
LESDLVIEENCNMAKKGLLRGGKFSMTHSTVIEAAEQFLMGAKRLDSISKISVGIIKPCIKFVMEQHAIRAQVRGVRYVQTFYIYGSDLNRALSDLQSVPTGL